MWLKAFFSADSHSLLKDVACHTPLSPFLPLRNRFVIQLDTFFTYCLRELIQNNSWLRLLRSSERTNNQGIYLPFFPPALCPVEQALQRQDTSCGSFWIPEPGQVRRSCVLGAQAGRPHTLVLCWVSAWQKRSSLSHSCHRQAELPNQRALGDLETRCDLAAGPWQISFPLYCAYVFLTLRQMTLQILTVLPLRQAAWLVSPLFTLSSHPDA